MGSRPYRPLPPGSARNGGRCWGGERLERRGIGRQLREGKGHLVPGGRRGQGAR